MAANNKNYTYLDKLLMQKKLSKKQSSRKIKNSMIVNGVSKDFEKKEKLNKSNIVYPTPPMLANSSKLKKSGRSPPKKIKTGKKKLKSKKNVGFDKYLKGPKNVISKFKAMNQ